MDNLAELAPVEFRRFPSSLSEVSEYRLIRIDRRVGSGVRTGIRTPVLTVKGCAVNRLTTQGVASIERIAGVGDRQDLSDSDRNESGELQCSPIEGCGGAAAQLAVASFDQAIRKIRRGILPRIDRGLDRRLVLEG
jgi:hypothetical protein